MLKTIDVFESNCTVKQDDIYLYLVYVVADNDCLIDFAMLFNKIIIKINKVYFKKYGQTLNLLPQKYNLCCSTQLKLYDLVNCKLNGVLRKIYLESIVLNLLAFTLKQKNYSAYPSDCVDCGFLKKPIQLDKIQKAKDFIINNLGQNITIPIIANLVGTNQCYLKKGFKQMTGQTIFEFLKENRMISARYLLQNTNNSVQEVSSLVGYASISSFSQAYKHYFGLAPSLEQQQVIAK